MLFSIVIPVFNCENSIKSCIESILKQNIEDYEVVLVNNNSTDNSVNVIKQIISDKQNHFKLIDCFEQGAGPARNTGIKASSGKYILTVDSDDIIDENLLFNLKKIINNNDNIDIIKFNANQITSDGQILNSKVFCTQYKGILNGLKAVNYCCEEFIKNDIISGPSWLYAINRNYFLNQNLYFSNLLQEDFGFFIYMLLYANKVYFSDFVGYYYVFREVSITNNSNNQLQKAQDLIRHCSHYKTTLIDSQLFNIELTKSISSFLKKSLKNKYLKLSDIYKQEFLKMIELEALSDIYYNTSL